PALEGAAITVDDRAREPFTWCVREAGRHDFGADAGGVPERDADDADARHVVELASRAGFGQDMIMRALSLLVVAGCAADAAYHGGAPGTAPDAATAPVASVVGFNPGESMAYEVTLGGIVAGEAAISVGQPGEWNGHKAMIVRSRAATAGAVDLVK